MIRASTTGTPHQIAFTNGDFTSTADLPAAKGGAGQGFGPHELLEAALATCLTMTAELYAAEHQIPLESASAEVRIDRGDPSTAALVYTLTFDGPLSDDQHRQLSQAVARCPVGRTLAGRITCRFGR